MEPETKEELDVDYEKQLYEGCRSGDLDGIKRIIQKIRDIDFSKQSYLTTAIENRHAKTVAVLLEAGADANSLSEINEKRARCARGHQFGFIACMSTVGASCDKCGAIVGQRGRVIQKSQAFMESRLGFSSKIKFGGHVLWNSCQKCSWLVCGSCIGDLKNQTRIPAPAVAVEVGHATILNLLIEHEADINHCDKDNKTIMDIAIETQKTECILTILNSGKGVDMQHAWDVLLKQSHKEGGAAFIDSLKEHFVTSVQKAFIKPSDLMNVKQLSSGNFGITYKAEYVVPRATHAGILLQVVCKVPKESDGGTDDWFEFRILTNISRHPNVIGLVGICNSFESEGKERTAVVIPFKRGGSLIDFLEKSKDTPTLQKMTSLSIGMAKGVNHLHRNGYVHSDIACRNFLLAEQELPEQNRESPQIVVLTDFGLARPGNFARDGSLLVPWRWCSPQILDGSAKTIRPQDDVYMFGITMLEMSVKGKVPFFWIHSPRDLSAQIKESNSIPLCFPVTTKKSWKNLISDCCQIDANKRISMPEVLQKLTGLHLVESECNSSGSASADMEAMSEDVDESDGGSDSEIESSIYEAEYEYVANEKYIEYKEIYGDVVTQILIKQVDEKTDAAFSEMKHLDDSDENAALGIRNPPEVLAQPSEQDAISPENIENPAEGTPNNLQLLEHELRQLNEKTDTHAKEVEVQVEELIREVRALKEEVNKWRDECKCVMM